MILVHNERPIIVKIKNGSEFTPFSLTFSTDKDSKLSFRTSCGCLTVDDSNEMYKSGVRYSKVFKIDNNKCSDGCKKSLEIYNNSDSIKVIVEFNV